MHEFYIMQNPALGALAIRSFVREYHLQSVEKRGPILPLIMPVLPLVFNERTSIILSEIRRITNSRFLSTLSEYRDLPSGLQNRMVKMSDQTLDSLNLALKMNIVSYDSQTTIVDPVNYQKKIPKLQHKNNQNILHAARILGNWFASYSIEEICISLNIYY